MEILFVTREPDVCRLIASHLADETVRCAVQDNVLDWYISVQDGTAAGDLIVLDFCQFQHLLCNVGELFRRLKDPVPFVFYNDPYPNGKNRVVYWLQQNESLYAGQSFHHLFPVFTRLNDIIENPLVRPHISLLQPPVPVPHGAPAPAVPACDQAVAIAQFRVRSKIPPALFVLFEYFYANLSKEVSVKEIARQLFGTGFCNGIRRNCVYSYVSRLKKYMHADAQMHVDIIRSSQERYKMVTCL